jgi:hypothetical protein
MTPDEDVDDPRHIYQARAWHAAREAERDFERSLRLVDPDPDRPIGPVAMVLRALATPSGDLAPTRKETA